MALAPAARVLLSNTSFNSELEIGKGKSVSDKEESVVRLKDQHIEDLQKELSTCRDTNKELVNLCGTNKELLKLSITKRKVSNL